MNSVYHKPKASSNFKINKSTSLAKDTQSSSKLKINKSFNATNVTANSDNDINTIIERNTNNINANLSHTQRTKNNFFCIKKSLFKEEFNNEYLQIIIESGDFNEFKSFFEKENFSERINSKVNKFQETALHIAIEQGYNNIINFLLEKGANPNIQQQDGETPLHYALKYNHSHKVVKLLLLYNANPLIKSNKTLENAIDYASKDEQNSKSLEILKEHLMKSKSFNSLKLGVLGNSDDYLREFSFKNKQNNKSFTEQENHYTASFNINQVNQFNQTNQTCQLMRKESSFTNQSNEPKKKDSAESPNPIQETLIIHSSKFCNLEEKLKYIQLNSLSNTSNNMNALFSNNHKGIPSIYNFYNYNYSYNNPVNQTPQSNDNNSFSLVHHSSNSNIDLHLPSNRSKSGINHYPLSNSIKKKNLQVKRSGSVLSTPMLDVLAEEPTDRVRDSNVNVSLHVSPHLQSVESSSTLTSCDISNETPKRSAADVNVFKVNEFKHDTNESMRIFLEKCNLLDYYDILVNNGLDDIKYLKDETIGLIRAIYKYSSSVKSKYDCCLCKVRMKIFHKILKIENDT